MNALRSLGVFAVLLVGAAPPASAAEGAQPQPAQSQPAQQLTYEGWLGGLKALAVDSRIVRSEGAYRVTLTARTEGLIGWLYPYRLALETVGSRQSADHRPQRFRSESHRPDKTRKLIISYGEDGAVEARREPPRASPDSDAPPDRLTRETLDPVSALLTMIASTATAGTAKDDISEGGACRGVARVFDGKRRYDLRAQAFGTAILRPSRYSVYSGPATLCRITLEPLAGFKKEKRLALRMPREVTLWLAPLSDGGAPLPVRMEGESSFGGLVVHLVGAEAKPQSAER